MSWKRRTASTRSRSRRCALAKRRRSKFIYLKSIQALAAYFAVLRNQHGFRSIFVTISSPAKAQIKLTLTYLVHNACWSPYYVVHVTTGRDKAIQVRCFREQQYAFNTNVHTML